MLLSHIGMRHLHKRIPRVAVAIHHLLLLYMQYLQGKWNGKESWSKRD
jgi:hypothetical protein